MEKGREEVRPDFSFQVGVNEVATVDGTTHGGGCKVFGRGRGERRRVEEFLGG